MPDHPHDDGGAPRWLHSAPEGWFAVYPGHPLYDAATPSVPPPAHDLLDYFAAAASQADIDVLLGDTVGDVAAKLQELGFIAPCGESKAQRYQPRDYLRLRTWARYEFAAAMIAERAKRRAAHQDTTTPANMRGRRPVPPERSER